MVGRDIHERPLGFSSSQDLASKIRRCLKTTVSYSERPPEEFEQLSARRQRELKQEDRETRELLKAAEQELANPDDLHEFFKSLYSRLKRLEKFGITEAEKIPVAERERVESLSFVIRNLLLGEVIPWWGAIFIAEFERLQKQLAERSSNTDSK